MIKSDTISNTVKQSKQYDQQYNQDKPGDGNSYIVSNIYKKAKDLNNGLILGGYREINSKAIFIAFVSF